MESVCQEEMRYIIMERDNEGGAHYNVAPACREETRHIIMEWDDEGGVHYNVMHRPDQQGRNVVHYNVMGQGAKSALLCGGGIHCNREGKGLYKGIIM